jgi:hypothetical protein
LENNTNLVIVRRTELKYSQWFSDCVFLGQISAPMWKKFFPLRRLVQYGFSIQYWLVQYLSILYIPLYNNLLLLYSYYFNPIKNTHLRHVTVHYFSVLYNRKPYFFRIVHYVREVTRWFLSSVYWSLYKWWNIQW